MYFSCFNHSMRVFPWSPLKSDWHLLKTIHFVVIDAHIWLVPLKWFSILSYMHACEHEFEGILYQQSYVSALFVSCAESSCVCISSFPLLRLGGFGSFFLVKLKMDGSLGSYLLTGFIGFMRTHMSLVSFGREFAPV